MTTGLISDPALRQQRIDQKKQQLLSWLVDFTWTTPAIAGKVMGPVNAGPVLIKHSISLNRWD